MFEEVSIPVADLQLDTGNPRFGEEQESQQAAALKLAKQQGRHIVKLAEDIVDFGLDPTALVAVVATSDRHRKYKVLEGNRRVLALKALETPTLVAGALTSSEEKRLQQLSGRYHQGDPIEGVRCVLFDKEEQAYHWIELRHTGNNEGAGLDEWDADEKDRFRSRHPGGAKGRKPGGQVIDFVVKATGMSAPKKIMSNVNRLVVSAPARDALGIDIIDGQVVSSYPKDEVLKGLKRVVEDFDTGGKRVTDIYYDDDKRDYLNTFKRTELPAKSKRLPAPVPLLDLLSGRPAKPVQPRTARRRRKPQADRTTLIPSTSKLNPTVPRINAIYNELATLTVDQYPNACAVLLRVFMELSVDHYLAQHNVMTEAQMRSAPLAQRMKTAADHLKKRSKIDEALRKAVYTIASSSGHIVIASATTFNQYVHNKHVFPKPSELRTAWDELEPFLEKVCL